MEPHFQMNHLAAVINYVKNDLVILEERLNNTRTQISNSKFFDCINNHLFDKLIQTEVFIRITDGIIRTLSLTKESENALKEACRAIDEFAKFCIPTHFFQYNEDNTVIDDGLLPTFYHMVELKALELLKIKMENYKDIITNGFK